MRHTLAKAFALLALSAAAGPVEYVNAGIGSISHMLVPTFRTVQRPNGMFRFNGPAGRPAISSCRAIATPACSRSIRRAAT